jgi:bifunctional DNA-binding transcriptional regulator/antitoxin component of YhaV-PrlF toxin-antitoxin module
MRERGQLTIPQPVRDSLAGDQGNVDILTLVQVGDIVILTPKQLRLPQLSEAFSAIMDEEGVTLADLLEGLEEERKAIWRERQDNGH